MTTENVVSISDDFKQDLKTWSQQITKDQNYLNTVFGIIALVSLVAGFAVAIFAPSLGLTGFWMYVYRGIIGFVALLVVGVGGTLIFHAPQLAIRYENILSQIQQTMSAQQYDPVLIVRQLNDMVNTGELRDKLFKEIAPSEAVLLANHDDVMGILKFLEEGVGKHTDAVAAAGRVDELQQKAADYIEHGFYAEGLSLVITIHITYHAMANAAPQIVITQGNTRYTLDTPWKTFDYLPALETLNDLIVNRTFSTTMQNLLEQMQAGPVNIGSLDEFEQVDSFDIRDEELVQRCSTVIMKYAVMTINADDLAVMLYTPDYGNALALIGSAFSMTPFAPKQIEAAIRHSQHIEDTLRNMVQGNDINARFNAALALGSLKHEPNRALADEILANDPDPVSAMGAYYMLAQLGDQQAQEAVFPYLDHEDELVRHVAAIVLEHLPFVIPDEVLLKHLQDNEPLVQLRLARHTRKREIVSQEIADAIVALTLSDNADVARIARETLAELKVRVAAEDVEVALVHVDREADLNQLLDDWKALKRRVDKNDEKMIAHLEKLIATGSPRVVPILVQQFNSGQYEGVALSGLIRLGSLHPKAVEEAVTGIKNKLYRAFLQIALGDKSKTRDLLQAMAVGAEDISLGLNLIRFLGYEEFEERVRELLTYTGAQLQPQNFVIRYQAFLALVAILAQKGAVTPAQVSSPEAESLAAEASAAK